ncbi:MAG: hypothetical protein KAV87_39260 [Desulfobacteraceae bacterium]|nr:hypothetical protein [Desulfobacteraceae bacterium]
MPIDFFMASDGVHVRQSFDSPTVYLDHWAIRMFSDDQGIQDRFVNALMSKGGTILLSNVSFIEFARATDARHCRDAEAFFERLLPNIFLTDFALDKILEQEGAEPNNQRRFWPSADLPQLKLFAERAQHTPLGFTMNGFISQVHIHRADLSNLTKNVACSIINGIESARNDPAYVRKAKNSSPSEKRPRTMVILGELIRGYNLDRTAPISENDAIDLLHAAMSTNCCDYVLLDGPWTERVEKMRHRIAKAGMTMPIAKCFSNRANGVSVFLAELEAFVKHEGRQQNPTTPLSQTGL